MTETDRRSYSCGGVAEGTEVWEEGKKRNALYCKSSLGDIDFCLRQTVSEQRRLCVCVCVVSFSDFNNRPCMSLISLEVMTTSVYSIGLHGQDSM